MTAGTSLFQQLSDGHLGGEVSALLGCGFAGLQQTTHVVASLIVGAQTRLRPLRTVRGDIRARVEPFDGIELDLTKLWA